jgi:hypothetical protein
LPLNALLLKQNLSKNTEDLNDKQQDLTDIFRILHQAAKSTLFPSTQEIFINIGHSLGHKNDSSIFKGLSHATSIPVTTTEFNRQSVTERSLKTSKLLAQ